MHRHVGGRLAVAVVTLTLVTLASVTQVEAVNPVMPGDPGGGMICKSCGTNVNVQQTSGTATSGYANSNGDGTANVGMAYSTPNDGTTYSGTSSIVVTDQNGSIVENLTGGITDAGNGTQMSTGQPGLTAPLGGSISIRINESNGIGGSFSASWNLRNFRP